MGGGAGFGTNKKPLALGESDKDKLLLNLSLNGTKKFWEDPPLDRINVKNGILNLDTLNLEPHSPEFL